VGRTGARAALRRWAAEAGDGQFRLVTITGPAGIGKSRMLAWVAEEHRRRGGVVWLGRCSPELSPPFGPIATALGRRWPTVADTMSEATVGVVPSIDPPAPTLPQVHAVADVVTGEAANRPVLLALDDAHWADPGTLGALEQLVYILASRGAAGCRVLLVLTHRTTAPDSPAAGVLARLAREPTFRSLPLDALAEVELHELIRRLIAAPPDRRLVQRVFEASGGNPLVAISAADDLIGVSAGPRRPLGRTVDEVVARHLASLTPPAVRLALALAVNARPASIADLAGICDLPDDVVGQAADELERAGLVTCVEDAYDVVAPHVGEAALAAATTRERQAMHGRIADLCAAASEGPDLLILAHHLERAGLQYASELGKVALAAADRAFATGAWGWAARLYEVALRDRPPDAAGLAGLEERAGIACFRDFDSTRCEQHLAAAVDAARANADPELAARATLWLVRRRFTSGTQAIGRWIDVLPLDDLVGDDDLAVGLRAQAHGLLAEIAFQANDLPQARMHATEAQALAERTGEDMVGFWVAASEGLALLGTLELDAAALAFAEADRCVHRSGHRFVRSAGACRLAAIEMMRGDLRAADDAAARAAADAEEAANWSEHALAETIRAIVAGQQGRFDDQEDHGERARVSVGRSATTFPPLLLHPAMAWGRAARGDLDGCRAALDDLDAAGGRAGRYTSALRLLAEDPDRLGAGPADHVWRDHPPELTAYDAGAHAAQLELAIHVDNHEQIAAGCALFERFHHRGGRFVLDWPSLVPRLVAEAKARLGLIDEALDWIQRAEQAATSAGARVELARLAIARARILLGRGDDESVRGAVALVDGAARELDALGLLRLAREAQRLLDVPPGGDAPSRALRARAILFTDIVDSTAWNVRLGDDHWLVVMAEHNRLARAAVRRRRGVVVKTTGDGICAWFAEPGDAVDCAAALQAAFAEFGDAHPDMAIRIRCGVAVGDVVDFDGDVAGLAVTEAARICAVAQGAQVVASAEVRRLDHRSGRGYSPLGLHDLKGLPEPMPLFAVDGTWETQGR
jgi:class 3 adenylate cyclase